MVTINFTVVVELGLFLLFLWGTGRFVLRPLLKSVDEREAAVESDQQQAETDTIAAEKIEKQYASELVAARRGADERFREARTTTLRSQANIVTKRQHEGDGVVAATRAEADAQVDAERASFEQLAEDLAQTLSAKLGVGGKT